MGITEKIWYILIDKKSEGPLSYLDLERDERFTPNTLIWKEGWPEWKKAKDVDDFIDLFKKNGFTEENLGHEGVESMDRRWRASFSPWAYVWILIFILVILWLWWAWWS